MDIITFTPEYEQNLIDLWVECDLTVPWNNPEKDIRRKLDENQDQLYIVLEGETIVASCMAGYDGHRGWLYYLCVKPSFQKTGIARRLVEHCEAELAKIGCPKINLMIRKTNLSVIDFYHAIGYQDDPVVVLSKRLVKDTFNP